MNRNTFEPSLKRVVLLFSYFTILGAATSDLFAQSAAKDSSSLTWDGGLLFEYFDKSDLSRSKAELEFGGRIHYDVAFFNQDPSLSAEVGEIKNSLEFRRVRLFTSGELFYGSLNYKFQIEFAGAEIAFRDVYLEYRLAKLNDHLSANIRVGQFKEPIRFEVQESSNSMSFIERSYLSAFMQERNSGFMFHLKDDDRKFSFQTGLFGNAADDGNDLANNDGINVTSRITYAPIAQRHQTLHFGLAHSYRDAGDAGKFSFSARPPAHTAPKYIRVEIPNNVNTQLAMAEALYIHNNLMLQSEFLVAQVHSERNYTFSSLYGQISYFLPNQQKTVTGHLFKGALGGLEQSSLKNAWEVAVRYSYANLNDGDFNGGKINDITFGVNYYLNNSAKIMANYSLVNVDQLGKSRDLGLRFMLVF